jgi:hypothetical protein
MAPFYEAARGGSGGFSDPKYRHFGSEMLQTDDMMVQTTQSWIQDADAAERDEVILTTAELAECTCPDPCECDHDN